MITVQLGQFTDENAERIAARLEEAGINWWHKSTGHMTRFFFAGDWGTRIFVDEERLVEARQIATEVTGGA